MLEKEKLSNHINQFFYTLSLYKESVDFVQKHKLWKGFWRYGWVGKVLTLIGVLVSLRFVQVFFDWLGILRSSDDSLSVVQGASSLFQGISDFHQDLFQTSSLKYLVLLLLEVMIFHFAVKTINILEKEDYVPTIRDFIRAEIRMFKVVVRSWFLELVISVIIGIVLSLFGMGFAKVFFIFFVQCYYLGFAFVDNYSEQYGLTLKESGRYMRKYAGAIIAIGMISYALFLIPIIGPIIAPLLGAVTSTLFMHRKTDIHLVNEPMYVQ